jgi:hypothetical protein
MNIYTYECNQCKKTYPRVGVAVTHERATGHTSFKIVVHVL